MSKVWLYPAWKDAQLRNPQPYYDLQGFVIAHCFTLVKDTHPLGYVVVGSSLYEYHVLEAGPGAPPSPLTAMEAKAVILRDLGWSVKEEDVATPLRLVYLGYSQHLAIYDVQPEPVGISLELKRANLQQNLGSGIRFEGISDGADGIIVVWIERDACIRAQRIGADGRLLWGPDGIVVRDLPQHADYEFGRYGYHVASDGQSGAFVVWKDRRQRSRIAEFVDIYAQRIDSEGRLVWSQDGIPVYMGPRGQKSPQIVGDNIEGAIIVWSDYDPDATNKYGISAQKVDRDGRNQWGEAGVILSTSVGPMAGLGGLGPFSITADSAGDLIVSWRDSYPEGNSGVYAQKLGREGTAQWQPVGVPVTKGNFSPKVAANDGGATVSWQGNNHTIRSQGLDTTGKLAWPDDGVTVRTSQDLSVELLETASDGRGGTVTLWQEVAHTPSSAQLGITRIDGEGNRAWDSVIATGASSAQTFVADLTMTTASELVVAFKETESPKGNGLVLAQKTDLNGKRIWSGKGIPVFNAQSRQYVLVPKAISDGSDGAFIVSAVGDNNEAARSIVVQRLDAQGNPLWQEGGVSLIS